MAASLPRHGGVKLPLRNADLKVAATIPLSYRVEDRMRLAKDRRSLKINDSLTLGAFPPKPLNTDWATAAPSNGRLTNTR